MLIRLASALLTVCLLATASPASAQIYSWRDDGGNLVVSNMRPGEGFTSPSYAVPAAEGVRATTYVPPDRTRQYDSLIAEHARLNGVRVDLVRAVIQVESAFNQYARSPKGAVGLMQLMPATMKLYGVVNAYDAAENIRAGVAYLRGLLDRYENNEELALAAYNAGPTAVDRYGQNVPPYRETQQYVTKVSRIAGPPVKLPGTNIYRFEVIVDGQMRVMYSTDPNAKFNLDAQSPSDQAVRTPAQVLQSSEVFRAR
jgi:soluble lytic murein transglycosylase-like protein